MLSLLAAYLYRIERIGGHSPAFAFIFLVLIVAVILYFVINQKKNQP